MNGALGRMGRLILTLAHDDPSVTISGAADIACDQTGRDIGLSLGFGPIGVPLSATISEAISGADVVIDFTWADAVEPTASVCANAGIPIVIGTTGLSAEQRTSLTGIVSKIPCVFAPNMSVGVNLLFRIVEETARILGDDYDVEIVEAHHRFKKDAPSGTARRIAEIVAESLGRNLENDAVFGRNGMVGERGASEIGIQAVRAGDIVGEHMVMFANLGERIELVHRAHSRNAFATGAIRAAKFAMTAAPGIYDMQDVLGLKRK